MTESEVGSSDERHSDNGEQGVPLTRLHEGSVLRHHTGGIAVLGLRKTDDSGWWCITGGGIADRAVTSGDWFLVAESVGDLVTRFERAVLSDIEARNPGIDVDEVQAHRDRTARIVDASGRRPSDG